MLDFGYYNMDCMDGMKEFPDKYFDLAVIDPPYGIGENGSKNKSRGKIAKAKDYKTFAGKDAAPLIINSSKNCSELVRIRLFLAQIILFQEFRLIAPAGLFGTKIMEIAILQTVSWRGHLLKVLFANSSTRGKE